MREKRFPEPFEIFTLAETAIWRALVSCPNAHWYFAKRLMYNCRPLEDDGSNLLPGPTWWCDGRSDEWFARYGFEKMDNGSIEGADRALLMLDGLCFLRTMPKYVEDLANMTEEKFGEDGRMYVDLQMRSKEVFPYNPYFSILGTQHTTLLRKGRKLRAKPIKIVEDRATGEKRIKKGKAGMGRWKCVKPQTLVELGRGPKVFALQAMQEDLEMSDAA